MGVAIRLKSTSQRAALMGGAGLATMAVRLALMGAPATDVPAAPPSAAGAPSHGRRRTPGG